MLHIQAINATNIIQKNLFHVSVFQTDEKDTCIKNMWQMNSRINKFSFKRIS